MTLAARFDQPLTIARTVGLISNDRLLLPGIQRNFVWKPKQITTLFDSVMREYPVGAVLAWRTRPGDHKHLPFRRFVTEYTGDETTLVKARPSPTSWIHAVLDGQQRLTAFNIGLRGSYSTSSRRAGRRLYLDLASGDEDPGAEGDQFKFEFRDSTAGDDRSWFPVSDALGLSTSRVAIDKALAAADLQPTAKLRRVLLRLCMAINHDPVLRFEVEPSPSLDRVLNVFARTNIGGTKLSYVDLLVGTATARWAKLDAKASFEKLRNEMNDCGEGFRFTADRLVKAGLVLLDANEPKFHVDTFTKGDKAKKLEESWPAFERSMLIATRTLADFKLSGRTLAAENVLIPVAYYAKHRKLGPTYPTAHAHERDRIRVRAFVARTLLQRGYWTGAVDPVLVATRRAIKAHGSSAFPLAAIEHELHAIKPISVTSALLDELCELRYGDRRTLVLLRLLFPGVVPAEGFDKDHVFPASRFTAGSIRNAGLSASKMSSLTNKADRLPNLQLLDRVDNRGGGKVARYPKEWLQSLSTSSRRRYTQQYVNQLPAGLEGFEAFWNRRRSQIRADIAALLMADPNV